MVARVAPRPARYPADKVRGGRTLGIFDRRATPSAGLHRRLNAAGLLPRACHMRGVSSRCAAILLAVAAMASGGVRAFGADGHRIAGLVAEEGLCATARVQVRVLGQGQGLDELGLWADGIRREPGWERSAPWHYMNIPDGARLEDYRHPPEGDILWAIDHFSGELRDPQAPDAQRRNALRFLVHFVVDIHQPLHVGRESDRGGNSVQVDAGTGRSVNLHRFWDTEAVDLSGLTVAAYARSLAGLIDGNAERWEQSTVMGWARESRSLRPRVYDFDAGDGRLSPAYLEAAERITRLRLAQGRCTPGGGTQQHVLPGDTLIRVWMERVPDGSRLIGIYIQSFASHGLRTRPGQARALCSAIPVHESGYWVKTIAWP